MRRMGVVERGMGKEGRGYKREVRRGGRGRSTNREAFKYVSEAYTLAHVARGIDAGRMKMLTVRSRCHRDSQNVPAIWSYHTHTHTHTHTLTHIHTHTQPETLRE